VNRQKPSRLHSLEVIVQCKNMWYNPKVPTWARDKAKLKAALAKEVMSRPWQFGDARSTLPSTRRKQVPTEKARDFQRSEAQRRRKREQQQQQQQQACHPAPARRGTGSSGRAQLAPQPQSNKKSSRRRRSGVMFAAKAEGMQRSPDRKRRRVGNALGESAGLAAGKKTPEAAAQERATSTCPMSTAVETPGTADGQQSVKPASCGRSHRTVTPTVKMMDYLKDRRERETERRAQQPPEDQDAASSTPLSLRPRRRGKRAVNVTDGVASWWSAFTGKMLPGKQ
ncbi:hypothetical protein CYMTET_18887, partial [Cymbomonas tetramitiformis]